MTSGGEKFGDTGRLEAGLCETEGSSQASTPRTTEVEIQLRSIRERLENHSHDNGIVLMLDEGIFSVSQRLHIR